MRKHAFAAGAVVLAAAALTGCDSNRFVVGASPDASDEREVSTFDQIGAEGTVQVEVSAGEKQSVRVEGPRNLIRFVETRIDDDTLEIRETAEIDPEEDIVVHVTVERLSVIAAGGSVRLEVQNLDADNLLIVADGRSHIDVSGAAGRVGVLQEGSSVVSIRELDARRVHSHVDGSAELQR